MTQPGTWLHAAMLCLAVSACREASIGADAGADAAQPRYAGGCASRGSLDATASCEAEEARKPPTQGDCRVHTDCVLVDRGCCGPCLPPSKDQVLAVPKTKAEEVRKEQCPGPPACGACETADPDPLTPVYAAGCVEHRCQLVDLRADEISRCETDGDCAAVSRYCCPAYSSDPAEHVGVRESSDHGLLACFPAPPCVAPGAHPNPIAFCASDGQCAVRRRETFRGAESAECYSPDQNLERAYRDDAVGCDCTPRNALCRTDNLGRQVALVCQDGEHWQAVEDGPCAP